MYDKLKTLFLGLLQQSGGSASTSLVSLACFSLDSKGVPNRAPTPTYSTSGTPSTDVGTLTYKASNQIKADTQKYATKNWVIIIITFYSTLQEKQVMTNYLFNWPKTKTYVNSYWDYFLNSTHHIFSGLNKEEYDEEYGKNSSDMKPTS